MVGSREREREIIERFPRRLWSYFWLTETEGRDVVLIYLAGNTILVERERDVLRKKPDRLNSFFFIQPDQLQHKAWEYTMRSDKPIKIFLDSGAYSAWTQNVNIDIHEYINFIKKYEDKLEVYANLDVIKNPVATFRNQMIMERAGLDPIPVFHYGSDIKWLKKYLGMGKKYIALGVAGNNTTDKLAPWLDELFSDYLTDSDGYPLVKLHGFAVTNFSIMLRYPWYSVDSTSWIITGRNGGIYVPAFKNNSFSYSIAPYKVNVSNRSPDSATDQDHISCMPKRIREIVMNYIHSKGYDLGESEWVEVPLDYELRDGERWLDKKAVREKKGKGKIERRVVSGLSNDYRKRDEMNIIYFADLEKSMPEWPWPFKMKRRAGFGL